MMPSFVAGVEARDGIYMYFRSILIHYATLEKSSTRPIGGNITDHAAVAAATTSVIVVLVVVVVCDLIFRPAERGGGVDVSGVARQRGSAVGWVMSGNAANEVYEDT